ncbi:MAG: hypothetical protein EZS28_034106 [Streblomastix strix]|uniref:Uncharacterized protein n=1 Tax=Streblomastix strix TaxID=222440 RepID=A0A5J4UIS7_9EUKA|nr:MAG: hypothetical protein EZS28_034106 [Streblomastix strix]
MTLDFPLIPTVHSDYYSSQQALGDRGPLELDTEQYLIEQLERKKIELQENERQQYINLSRQYPGSDMFAFNHNKFTSKSLSNIRVISIIIPPLHSFLSPPITFYPFKYFINNPRPDSLQKFSLFVQPILATMQRQGMQNDQYQQQLQTLRVGQGQTLKRQLLQQQQSQQGLYGGLIERGDEGNVFPAPNSSISRSGGQQIVGIQQAIYKQPDFINAQLAANVNIAKSTLVRVIDSTLTLSKKLWMITVPAPSPNEGFMNDNQKLISGCAAPQVTRKYYLDAIFGCMGIVSIPFENPFDGRKDFFVSSSDPSVLFPIQPAFTLEKEKTQHIQLGLEPHFVTDIYPSSNAPISSFPDQEQGSVGADIPNIKDAVVGTDWREVRTVFLSIVASGTVDDRCEEYIEVSVTFVHQFNTQTSPAYEKLLRQKTETLRRLGTLGGRERLNPEQMSNDGLRFVIAWQRQ